MPAPSSPLGPLAPDDRARLGMETPENPMVVTAVIGLDGTLDREALRRLVEARLLGRPRMRARVVRSLLRRRWVWKSAGWSALDRVTPIALARGDPSDADVEDLVSDLANRPIDVAEAPWHLWLVEGGPRSTLVFRAHHALTDGRGLLRLLFAFSDEGVGIVDDAPPSRADDARPPIPSMVAALARLVARPFDPPTALAGRLSGQRRIAWTKAIDLPAWMAAAHAQRAHFNDVFLAVLARALVETEPSVARAEIHALVPVALRHAGSDVGNHYVSVFVPLPCGVASLTDRIRAVRDAMRDARRQNGVGLGRLLIAGASILGEHAERVAVRTLSRKASLVASNLAGPPVPLHVAGLPVTDVMFAAPAPGAIALSASALTYAGALRVTFSADAAVVRDPRRIACAFDAEAARIGPTSAGRTLTSPPETTSPRGSPRPETK